MPKFIVSPRVTPIAQDTDMSCWAAALAMLHNWKYPALPKSPKDLATDGGQQFLEYYDFGLPHSADAAQDKFNELVAIYQLSALPLQTYTLDQWLQRLSTNGPLAILADDGQDGNYYTHLLVLEGIDWQSDFSDAIFYIVDPNGGVADTRSAAEIEKLLEAKDVVSLTEMKGCYYP
jgi:hypothetical protein